MCWFSTWGRSIELKIAYRLITAFLLFVSKLSQKQNNVRVLWFWGIKFTNPHNLIHADFQPERKGIMSEIAMFKCIIIFPYFALYGCRLIFSSSSFLFNDSLEENTFKYLNFHKKHCLLKMNSLCTFYCFIINAIYWRQHKHYSNEILSTLQFNSIQFNSVQFNLFSIKTTNTLKKHTR